MLRPFHIKFLKFNTTIGHDLNEFETNQNFFIKNMNNLKKNTFKQNHGVICNESEMEKGKMQLYYCLVYYLVFVA